MEDIDKRLTDIATGLSVPFEKIKLIYDKVKTNDRMNGDDLRLN